MKTINLPVEKVCVLNTSHITLKDSELLGDYAGDRAFQPPGLPRLEKHEYGWLVFLAPGTVGLVSLRREGFSQSFIRICKLARTQGFSFIDFDNASEVVDGLPTFDW